MDDWTCLPWLLCLVIPLDSADEVFCWNHGLGFHRIDLHFGVWTSGLQCLQVMQLNELSFALMILQCPYFFTTILPTALK